jgi:hypothetical protein
MSTRAQVSKGIFRVSFLLIVVLSSISLAFIPSKFSSFVHAPLTANAQVILPSTNDFLTYENSTAGIKINYSSSWQIIPPSTFGVPALLQTGTDPSRLENVTMPVNFVSALQDAFFFIQIEQLDQNTTLDNFVEKELAESFNLTNPQLKNVLGNLSMQGIQVSDLKIEEHSRTSLDGNPAHKIVSTLKFNYAQIPAEVEQKMMNVIALKDQKAYSLLYFGFGDSYITYLETAQKMIDSFEITGQNLATNNNTNSAK